MVRLVIFSLSLLLLAACGESGSQTESETPDAVKTSALKGRVRLDGSSTVFRISEAVAEEFNKIEPGVRVTVGISGTGGGFKKFLNSETDINGASRAIKPSEIEKAGEMGVEFIEIPVAFDGLSVVVNKNNGFVDYLTIEELHRIWQPSSNVSTWQDVRPEWPAAEIRLYGPGTDSGTFDYFTRVVNGKSQLSRADFTASEDDNVLVQGIAGDANALGYFGYAYYAENQGILKLVPIDGGNGPRMARQRYLPNAYSSLTERSRSSARPRQSRRSLSVSPCGSSLRVVMPACL